jgi:hypothetical protein
LAELLLPEITSLESVVIPAPVTFKPAPLLASATATPVRVRVGAGGGDRDGERVNTSPGVLRVMVVESAPCPEIGTARDAVNPDELVYVPDARKIAVQLASARSVVSWVPSAGKHASARADAGMSPTVAARATARTIPTIRRC